MSEPQDATGGLVGELFGRALGPAGQTAKEALARYLEWGDPAGATVRCFVCGHSLWTHYEGPTGGGCVAQRPPLGTLDQLIADMPVHPQLAGPDGCLCPGYLQGRLPRAIRKHWEGVGAGPCTGCGHDLEEHSEGFGCMDCPCETGLKEGGSPT